MTREQRQFVIESALGKKVSIMTAYCHFVGKLNMNNEKFAVFINLNDFNDCATINFEATNVKKITTSQKNELTFHLYTK
jgi:hypothetical protein